MARLQAKRVLAGAATKKRYSVPRPMGPAEREALRNRMARIRLGRLPVAA